MTTPAAQDRRAPLGILMVPRVALVLNASMVNVAIPNIRSVFGVTSGQVAAVNTAYAISFVLFMLLFGRLGDKVGSRRLLASSLGILAGGSVVNTVTRHFGLLLLGRFVQGIGGAGIITLAIASVVRAVPGERRGRALGAWNAVGPASAIAGPIVGGLVIIYFGWNAIFVLPLVVATLGAVFVLRRVARTEHNHADGADSYSWLADSESRRPLGGTFFGVAFAAATRMFSNASMAFLAALYFSDVYGLGPGAIGIILTSHAVGLGLTILVGGIWADNRGTRPPVLWSMAVTTATFAGLAADSSATWMWAAVVLVSLHGLAVGVSLAPLDRGATLTVPTRRVASAVGMYNFIRYSGAAAAPAVTGWVVQLATGRGMTIGASYNVAFMVCAVVALAGVCIAGTIPREKMSV